MRAVTQHYNRETFSELFKLAVPMVVSQGTFAVMIFTDRLFMSMIDPTHMAAALGGGVALFFSFCFFSGLFGYANALSAQYFGAREWFKCPKVVSQGLIMTVACLPVLAFIAYFVTDLFVRTQSRNMKILVGYQHLNNTMLSAEKNTRFLPKYTNKPFTTCLTKQWEKKII